MDQGGDILGEGLLRYTGVRGSSELGFDGFDLVERAQREHLEVLHHVAVVGVEPELAERVRAGQRRIEPHGAGFCLAELRAVGLRDQRGSQGMDGLLLDATDEVDARGEVAPLVGAAGLQGAAVAAVELEVVVALEDLVRELGEGDAGFAVEARGDGFLREHPVDREVLADVAEEVDGRQLRGPVEVVDDLRGVGAVEVEELLDLGADLRHPFFDDLTWVERPFPRHARVADEAGGAADEGQRVVSGLLEAGGGKQLDEVAHVQARGRRIETDIIGQRLLGQGFLQGGLVGGNCDEPAGLEFAEDVGHFGPFESMVSVGAEPTESILRARRGGCALGPRPQGFPHR